MALALRSRIVLAWGAGATIGAVSTRLEVSRGDRKPRRSAHPGVTELEADIRRWIDQWNADPKPFVWTKSADAILDTLAAYCQRLTAHDTRWLRAGTSRSGPNPVPSPV